MHKQLTSFAATTRAACARWQACFARLSMVLVASLLFSLQALAQYPAGSPVAVNGRLKLVGNKLSNECGNPVQLRGMSTHGPQWFGQCYTTSALDALSRDWGIDVFRIAMYVQEGGYVNDPNYWKNWIDNMVAECGKRGIYCIIDWHVLNPGNPNANLTEARDFWTYMSSKHKNDKHVLYEICNEPNGVDWQTVKSYANDIIPRIRANDPSTIIIVGSPTWSQDVDAAANDPLSGTNLMYTLHFYSGTHFQYLRDKANYALSKGLAIFVTEFGVSDASGNNGPYFEEGQVWLDWAAQNKISWVNWSFADKQETSAALNPGACGNNWNNTSPSGTWVKQRILNPADNFVCSNGGNTNPNPPTPPTPPTTATGPYKGVIALPGVVEAEDFDNGGEGVGYHDTTPTNLLGAYRPTEAVDIEATNGGGFNLGFSDNGEWLNYSVNVAQAGTYQLAVRYAAPASGGAFHFELDGQRLGAGFRISNEQVTGGWQNWALISQQVSLPAGAHVLRYVIDSKEYNTDKFTFTAVQVTPPTPPTTTTTAYQGVIQLPGVLETENYDNGGEGVAYHDAEAANLGGAYRTSEGVDLSPVAGGYLVGWINAGEWLKYSVNVASAGTYAVEARVSGYSGGQFHLELDQQGNDVSGPISVTGKNDWNALVSVTATAKLPAGAHVLRIVFDQGNSVFNLESLKFTAPAGGGGTTTGTTPVAGVWYKLQNNNSKQFLEIGSASQANGAKANQWPGNDCLCQQWQLQPTDGGYYRLVARHSGQSLEIGNDLTSAGAGANQYPANGCYCQQWRLEATSGGNYHLVERHSGLLLEIGNSSLVNGTAASQWPNTNAACQEWAFIPVSGARTALAAASAPAAAGAAELSLSPNPASEQVRVSWSGLTGEVSVSVRDLQGRLVRSERVAEASSTQVRTASLSAGLYLLQVQAGKTTLTKKLVITH